MVKKLFKHEYLAWLRVLPIIYGITLVVASMLRLVMLFESDSLYYDLVFGSAVFMLIVALIVTVGASTVFAIQRFYKNLFTGEGYLTHTLPVTPANHLWVKGLTAVSFDVMSVIVCLLAAVIVTAGDALTVFWQNTVNTLRNIPSELAGHFAGWAAEYLLLFLAALLYSRFFFYLCICIGQLFRKNRILASIGVYFGFYVLSQILSTVMLVAVAILRETGVLSELGMLFIEHPLASIHVALCGSAVLTVLAALVYYWICLHILRKRLNLE